jgi:hypothetical protein
VEGCVRLKNRKLERGVSLGGWQWKAEGWGREREGERERGPHDMAKQTQASLDHTI